MADKIVIEIYKTKAPDEFTKALAAPDSRLEIGSAAASTAASAAALLARAAALTAAETDGNERVDYILRNAETLRTFSPFAPLKPPAKLPPVTFMVKSPST